MNAELFFTNLCLVVFFVSAGIAIFTGWKWAAAAALISGVGAGIMYALALVRMVD